MFLKKVVQISVFVFISSVSINAAYSFGTSQTKLYQTEFTPVIPLPLVSNTAYSNICTGGVLIQEMRLGIYRSGGMGGGNGGGGMGGGNGQMPPGGIQGPVNYIVSFDATTRLAYNDPTGVNNDVCRAIPLNAKLVFLTTAITEDKNSTKLGSSKSTNAKAVNDVSSVNIVGSALYRSTRVIAGTASASVCLKTSHLSNSGGVVLLKPRELCVSTMFN